MTNLDIKWITKLLKIDILYNGTQRLQITTV